MTAAELASTASPAAREYITRAAEHLAEVKRMTPEEADAIERRMLQDMARRYGILQDAEKQRREGAKANAYRRARKQTEEKSA